MDPSLIILNKIIHLETKGKHHFEARYEYVQDCGLKHVFYIGPHAYIFSDGITLEQLVDCYAHLVSSIRYTEGYYNSDTKSDWPMN